MLTAEAASAAAASSVVPRGLGSAVPASSHAAAPAGMPTDTSPFPTATSVAAARAEAAATAAAVDRLARQSEAAQTRLLALQLELSTAVAAANAAQQELDRRAAAVAKAEAGLRAAQDRHVSATRAVANDASLAWQQGGQISSMSMLLGSDPGSLLDLQTVLDSRAQRVTAHLANAAGAASVADQLRALLEVSRQQQASATADAKAKQQIAQGIADRASAEAAALSAQEIATQQQLATLQAKASRLARQRSAGLAAQAAARRAAEAAARARAKREAEARKKRGNPVGGGGGGGGGGTIGGGGGSGDRSPAAAQSAARSMMGAYGWGSGQFSCLVNLWNGESGWSWSATNPSSGAYGIPQSLPAWKMATAGSDWLTNPVTQIRWGLGYINAAYGSPCNAWSRWLSRSPHWY